MSTSCIFALYDADTRDIILLEKTHDGFKDVIEKHITELERKDLWDIEDMANYLVKNHDYDVAIYSHKYPHFAYVYIAQGGQEYKLLEVKISPDIETLTDCLPDIQKVLGKDRVATIGVLEE